MFPPAILEKVPGSPVEETNTPAKLGSAFLPDIPTIILLPVPEISKSAIPPTANVGTLVAD